MVARLTRTAVSVLARAAGTVRTSRVAVNVLCNDTNPAAVRATRLAVNVLCADGTIFVDCSNSLGWTETIVHNRVDRTIIQSLGWVGGLGMDATIDIIQYIGWTTRFVVECSNSLFSETAFSGQKLNDVYAVPITNSLGWDNDVIRAHNANNSLSLSQTVLPIRYEECFNSLGWVDTVDSSGTVYTRDDTTQSLFRQRLTYTIQGTRCAEKEYTPFIGVNATDDYGTINTVAPTLTPGVLTLTYPYITPTTTLVLKNPEFGNSDSVEYSIVAGVTMGGEAILYHDPKWGQVEQRTMTITNLCDTLVQPFINFVNESLGKEIGLLDWESQQWRGIILQPDTIIQQTGRRAYRVTLNFQGRKV